MRRSPSLRAGPIGGAARAPAPPSGRGRRGPLAAAPGALTSDPVRHYLKRLVTTGAAYQFGGHRREGVCALLTLPLYTRHVGPAGYGAAELAARPR